jgi:hypothetical protein
MIEMIDVPKVLKLVDVQPVWVRRISNSVRRLLKCVDDDSASVKLRPCLARLSVRTFSQ